MLLDQLQIVVLECPYQSWQRDEVQNAFGKMIELKLNAYQNIYGKNIMTQNSSDFVASHLLVCRKEPNANLRPIMGFRSIEQKTCDTFHLNFPGIDFVNSARNANEHKGYVGQALQESREKNSKLYFLSSWAIDPQVRHAEKELVFQLTSILGSMIYYFHQEFLPATLMAAGVIRFRVPQFLKLLGFVPARRSNQSLEPIGAPFLDHEPTYLMDLKEFTPYAAQLSKKYQALWEKRIVIGQPCVSDSSLEKPSRVA